MNTGAGAPRETVRIDIWLWRARFFKTRSLAAKTVAEGLVRIVRGDVSRRVDKASTAIGVGDLLVFPAPTGVHAVRVLGLGARRGPASEARTLYAAQTNEA